MKKILKRLLLFLVFALLSAVYCEPSHSFEYSLKFAQLSDVHYSLEQNNTSYRMITQSKPLLEDAVKQINEKEHLDFVVLTGDGTDKPQEDAIYGLIDGLNDLKFRWCYAVGNHDTSSGAYVNKEKFTEIIRKKNPDFKFNSTYYSFRPKKGFKVIVLDGAVNEDRSSGGIIPAEELAWLEEELDNIKKNEIVLIFIHFPILPPYSAKNHEITNAEVVKDILGRYKMPIAIFSGHYHSAKITKRGNILHVSTPSLIEYPNAFRITEVINKRREAIFKIELIETGLKDVQAKAKITALGGALYYGRPKDRTATIIINKKK